MTRSRGATSDSKALLSQAMVYRGAPSVPNSREKIFWSTRPHRFSWNLDGLTRGPSVLQGNPSLHGFRGAIAYCSHRRGKRVPWSPVQSHAIGSVESRGLYRGNPHGRYRGNPCGGGYQGSIAWDSMGTPVGIQQKLNTRFGSRSFKILLTRAHSLTCPDAAPKQNRCRKVLHARHDTPSSLERRILKKYLVRVSYSSARSGDVVVAALDWFEQTHNRKVVTPSPASRASVPSSGGIYNILGRTACRSSTTAVVVLVESETVLILRSCSNRTTSVLILRSIKRVESETVRMLRSGLHRVESNTTGNREKYFMPVVSARLRHRPKFLFKVISSVSPAFSARFGHFVVAELGGGARGRYDAQGRRRRPAGGRRARPSKKNYRKTTL